jgi:hypothetical protein
MSVRENVRQVTGSGWSFENNPYCGFLIASNYLSEGTGNLKVHGRSPAVQSPDEHMSVWDESK